MAGGGTRGASRESKSPLRVPEAPDPCPLPSLHPPPFTKLSAAAPSTCRDLGAGVALSGGSIVLASKIGSGSVNNTIASHVTTGECNANGCMLINVTAKKIHANNCIVYNVVDDSEDGLVLPDGAVVTNVFMESGEKLVQTSSVTTDGGKVFKSRLSANPYSFNDVYKMNQDTDVRAAYAKGAAAHAALAATIG